MAVPRSHAFFASCEQQENPALRGQPIIVVQTMTDSAVAIAASYAAKAFGIKTGTLMRDARQLCPAVVPVQANHRLYTEYHERILKAVDTCLPVEKVCSIDEVACKLVGTERQVPVARELAVKVKRALREQVGECLTCSIGIAPNVFLAKAIGTPDDALRVLENYWTKTGGFGCILLLAHDWADGEATKRSYELFARYMLPRFEERSAWRSQSMDWMRANREAFSAKRKAAAASAVERHFADAQARKNREAAK